MPLGPVFIFAHVSLRLPTSKVLLSQSMVPPMSVGEPKDLRVVVIGAPKLDIVRVVVVNDTGFGSFGTMRVSSMFLSTNVKDGMWRLL